ncbi:MAG: T9SS type A sorting domain-containing protein [Bacteroidota bacterium]|nr:T9SS type A sorting domain-containing protein [Bacteroidota bacterium]
MKKSYTLIVLWALLTSLNAISLPMLSSFPSARATIFLDFDGQTVVSSAWNNGNTLVCAASGFTDTQITEIFNRVSEDYRPFNINITTDSTIFLAAPLAQRIRIIVTPTSSWYTGVGGISYTGSFTWGDDTPGFVFPDRLANSPKIVAECCTHESGHTVGLSHQSSYSNTCTLVNTYNAGVGTGEIGWAPVMGNSYYKNLTGWNNGPTPSGCTIAQDNLSIITTQNGFTYRTDDYSDDPNSNPALITISNQAFSINGIITTPADKDAFKFVFAANGTLHLNAIPFSVGANLDGADLDIKLTLLNASLQTIKTYDIPTLLNATIDTALNAGTYYVTLQGTGNANTTNYGSLGSYTVSGTFVEAGALPIRDVSLTGKADRDKHNLSWNIIADEAMKTIVVQSSTDGRFFSTLATLNAKETGFSYTPAINGDIFYKLKVTSVLDQTVFSNVITLKAVAQAPRFKVSTLVHDEIMVNAPANYKYQLADISGRVIETGSSNAGVKRINISNIPNGIYVIQMITNNQRQTERIIKQ